MAAARKSAGTAPTRTVSRTTIAPAPANDRVFIVDADTWIHLYQRNHPPDIFPSLWTRIGELITAGRIKTTKHVIKEVRENEGVGAWLRAQDETITVAPHGPIYQAAAQIVVEYPNLTRGITESADPWLIAMALHYGFVLVSDEVPNNSPKKTKIPNICDDKGIDCIRGIEMLRQLAIKI